MQRIDILKKGGNQDIDLRSSTPVEVDIDGNGIVESQENLAPDQKQSSNKVTKFLGKRRDICTDKEIPRYFHKRRGTDI